MKILVFGATGSIGSQVVEQALEEGYLVTAFTRSPSKLKSQPNLNITEGDVLNYDSVNTSMDNCDAVICTLGAGSKGTIRSNGTKHIIRAMEEHNIKRFICLSTLGAGDSRSNLNFFWKHIMFGFLLRKAFADHQKQEKYIRESNLEWTIVRPGAFTDGDRTGNYKHGFSSTNKKLAFKISRADVADFILKQLQDERYLYQAPGISY